MLININCPVNQLSYGIVGLNILKSLSQLGENVSLFPIGKVTVTSNEDEALVKQCLNNAEGYDSHAPSIRLYHQFDLASHVGMPRIGFPIFELDNFNSLEKHHIQSQDMVFVPSKWGQEVIKRTCNVNATVIPLGVDTEIFNPSLYKKQRSNNYIFLQTGKWEVRKGFDVLHKVFNDTFNMKDKVELWLMPHNIFLKPHEVTKWEQLYLNSIMGKANRIKILPRVQTQKEVAEIMSQVDCGISLSRGEGFNLPSLELLSMGKNLITTNYSGHSQFCNHENSYLVEIDELEIAHDGKWFFGQGQWAKLGEKQLKQASKYMRECYDDKKTNEEGIKTSARFSWSSTAKKILKAIEG